MKILSFRMKMLAVLLAVALFPLMATAKDTASANVDTAVNAVKEVASDVDTAANAVKQVASADKMEAVTVMGVVKKDGDKLVLIGEKETYLLDSPVDAAMIGQKVVATGVVKNNNGVKMLR